MLSYSNETLSPMVSTLVSQHLESCEFCRAELSLLAHHHSDSHVNTKPPEMPTNLRILAESILGGGGA